MGFHAKDKEGATNFKPCPAGRQILVCVDQYPIGVEKNRQYGTYHAKMGFAFESQHTFVEEESGKTVPYLVFAKFTDSFADTALLKKFIDSWAGRKIDKKALDRMDPDKTFIGKCADAMVVHSEDGKWANIQTVMPVRAGEEIKASGGYTRRKDREGYVEPLMDCEEAERQDKFGMGGDSQAGFSGAQFEEEVDRGYDPDDDEIPF